MAAVLDAWRLADRGGHSREGHATEVPFHNDAIQGIMMPSREAPFRQAPFHNDSGVAALDARRLVAALDAWREAEELALESGDWVPWAACRSNVVFGELRQKDFAAAERLATELLERFPRHEKGLYRRGLAREFFGIL